MEPALGCWVLRSARRAAHSRFGRVAFALLAAASPFLKTDPTWAPLSHRTRTLSCSRLPQSAEFEWLLLDAVRKSFGRGKKESPPGQGVVRAPTALLRGHVLTCVVDQSLLLPPWLARPWRFPLASLSVFPRGRCPRGRGGFIAPLYISWRHLASQI